MYVTLPFTTADRKNRKMWKLLEQNSNSNSNILYWYALNISRMFRKLELITELRHEERVTERLTDLRRRVRLDV